MRALLDVMRDNEADTQRLATACVSLMVDASAQLTILGVDSGGDAKLLHAVTVATQKLAKRDMFNIFENIQRATQDPGAKV